MIVTKETYDYKLALDGLDLLRKPFGQEILNSIAKKYVLKHCRMNTMDNIEEFILQCVSNRRQSKENFRDLTPYLCDKYEVGYFETSFNNCFDSDYILFNKDELSFWSNTGTDLFGLKFMVAVSRDWAGQVNELGFRILNPEKINNAVKWLFPFGQRATFGLHLCDHNSKLIVCEGFQDMIALRESGYSNTVGLGSVKLTTQHKKELRTDNYVMCQDMDSFGMQIRKKNFCFYKPDGKDPYEVYLKHGKVGIVEVQ